jgi:hypothetical protein
MTFDSENNYVIGIKIHLLYKLIKTQWTLPSIIKAQLNGIMSLITLSTI